MKGNPIRSVIETVQAVKAIATVELQKRLSRLSPRQRLYIVCGVFALFVIVDVYYIVSGFAGKRGTPIDVQHIENIDLHVKSLSNDDSR